MSNIHKVYSSDVPTLLEVMTANNAVKVDMYFYKTGCEAWLRAYDKNGVDVFSVIMEHNGYSSNTKVPDIEEAITIINQSSPLAPKTPGIFYAHPHLSVNEIIQLNLPVNHQYLPLDWIESNGSSNAYLSVTLSL